MSETSEESWAVVELLGHVTMAGKLSEEERFGAKMGRVDIPTDAGGWTTIYFGGSSVYRITPCVEAVARAKARSHQPKPVYAWEIPAPKDAETAPMRQLQSSRDDFTDIGDDGMYDRDDRGFEDE
jgi:hypothetical protein